MLAFIIIGAIVVFLLYGLEGLFGIAVGVIKTFVGIFLSVVAIGLGILGGAAFYAVFNNSLGGWAIILIAIGILLFWLAFKLAKYIFTDFFY